MAVYLITGSTEITTALFLRGYEESLKQIVLLDTATVILGTATGVDSMALNWLLTNGFPGKQITRFYKGAVPAESIVTAEDAADSQCRQRYTLPDGSVHVINYRDGFPSYPARDEAMRKIATVTIGRPMTYAGGGSGTTENLLWAAADINGKVDVSKVIAIGRNTCDGFDPRVQRLLYTDAGREKLEHLLAEM